MTSPAPSAGDSPAAPPQPAQPGLRASLVSATAEADLGRAGIGTTGTVFSWVVLNEGSAPTGQLIMSVASPDFRVQSECTTTLAPGASCIVSITLAPQNGGDLTSELTLGDGSTSVSLSLTGRGLVEIRVNAFGTGRIIGPGIDCPTECTTFADIGDSIRLEAVTTNDDTPRYFSSWSHPDCVGPDQVCSFTVTGAQNITANFSLILQNVVFVSSEAFPSNLGGPGAYDAECNRLATAAGINNADGDGYIAFLRDAENSLEARLPEGATQGWVRVDEEPFADDLASLFNGAVLNPPLFDERGRDTGTSLEVFTGMNPDGSAAGDCAGWTSAAGGNAQTGIQRGGPGVWLSAEQEACGGEPRPIYCIGAETAPRVVLSTRFGKLIWVTPPVFVPGPNADPDELCFQTRPPEIDAAVALLSRTDRAASELLDPEAEYVRVDGMTVGTGEQLLAPGAALQSGIWQAGDGTYLPGEGALASVLTGAPLLTDVGLPQDTCNDWTDAAGTSISGVSNIIGPDWWFRGAGGSCTPANADGFSIYCVEP